MRYCWSHHERQGNLIGPGVILLSALCLPRIITAMQEPNRFMPILMLTVVLFSYPALWAYVSARQYQINEDGILITYPFGIQCHYRWHEVREVALCKVHHSAGKNTHTVAIRCAFKNEDFGPAQANTSREKWATMAYEVINHRKIVSIYYTEQRLSEFEKKCPLPIGDYRGL